jgi:hypothetical protein
VLRLMRKLSVTQNISAWQGKVLSVYFSIIFRYIVSLCVNMSPVWISWQAGTAYKT